MANEFVAKNGLISQNNTTVSGSLTVSSSTSQYLAGDGTATYPAYAFSSSTNTGFRYISTPSIDFVVGGTSILTIYSNSWRFPTSTVTLRNVTTGNTVLAFRDSNSTANTPSNYLRVVGVATGSGNNPRIETVSNGSITNISLDLTPLGTGSINLLGTTIISGSEIISGSSIATLGYTGSLQGTASYATTASYALTAAGGTGGISQGKVVAISTGYSNIF